MKKIFGVTGLPGSGKSELGKIAGEKSYTVVRMGDMVWNHVEQSGLPLTSEIVGKTATKMRKNEGNDFWAKKTVEYINSQKKSKEMDKIIIDGIRSIPELEYFKSRFRGFNLICVSASAEKRYERIIARKRVDDTLSFDSFLERERRESSWGIKSVLTRADFIIDNENSLKEFQKKAGEIL